MLGVGVLAAAVAVAVVGLALGDVRLAVASSAVGVLFVVAAFTVPLRILWLPVALYALVPFVALTIFGRPIVGAVMSVAIAGITVVAGLHGLRGVAGTLQPPEEVSVDPEAAEYAAAFEALGFDAVGAYAFEPARGRTVVATVMLGQNHDECAVVTDLVLNVASTFGIRRLLTRNSGSASLPPEYLTNDLRAAQPLELVAAHRRGLELLAARGLIPDAIDRETLLETQLAVERRCAEWALLGSRTQTARALFDSGLGEGELDASPSSERRIDAWLAVPSPAV
jgi:hypothetical protein